ncbi:AMP-binding protein [Cyanobacterium sp. DS4]|uniref:AMP-binding protein n=1 Tax=Cyanobacterium sp. DS4 TaxID=2878255 RepID=UPI002E809B6D|nr:AMP-binding protein [Cyanobacterium sp. Dongsha4]WVK99710.1 AMP-binding protein [Cyanobacterium sp. Dongsha4]
MTFFENNPTEYRSTWSGNRKVTGIVSVNSLDFVKNIFQSYQNDYIVVLLNSKEDEKRINDTGVSKIISPKIEFGWSKLKLHPRHDNNIAQIAFTSGTTGQPKGVILTHEALNDVVSRLNEIMSVDSSIREYVGVPVNYSFGFGRCRAVATAGGEFYLPENGFNPLEIRDMLLDGAINAISAVPSLWRSLFQCQDIFGHETKNVKWIEIGSQYMSQKEKEKLCHLFPQATIVQHYGLTEASRTTFLRIDQTEGKYLESVGNVYGQTKIKISEEGKIMIKGPHVAQTLLVNGVEINNTDEQGWLTTGDFGKIEDDYLYYLGRADDLINCGGFKIPPDEIERYIREKLKIQSGIVVTKVADVMRGEAILVAILEDSGLNRGDVKNAAVDAIAQYNIHSADAVKVMELDSFPSTATGKIKRKEITKLFESNIVEHRTESQQQDKENNLISESEKEIIKVWKEVLGVDKIDINSNFFQMGGDSLTAISVMVKMEQLGISRDIVKGMLQGLTVRELAMRIEESQNTENLKVSHTISNVYTQTGMNINIIRGILVLCVIMGHWSEGFFNKLPEVIGSTLAPFIANLFAAGTPGFAVIYGVSTGYSLFSVYQNDRQRFQKVVSTTLNLLIGGVLILAITEITAKFLQGELNTFTDITNSFYSVISYYLLITATISLWFKLLSKFRNPSVVAICLSVFLYCSYYYIFQPLSSYRQEGLIELGKILISAKYSYFNLVAGTLGGIGIGIRIRENMEKNPIPLDFLWIGLALVGAAFVTSSHGGMFESWWIWPRPIWIWTWLFYTGLIMIGLRFIQQVLAKYNQFPPKYKFVFQFFSSIGILAFPFFITQDLVLPLKDTLDVFGVPSIISLAVVMLMFFGSSIFLFKKVYSVNYSW